MNIPNPDEPCWCGIPLKYRDCHMRIDSCDPDKRLAEARVAYAEKWEQNANNIENENGYEWMASLLKPYNPQRILDIGCGVGNGLAALLKEFPGAKVISLDENPELIERARLRVESSGAAVSVVRRLKSNPTGARSHALSFELGKLRFSKDLDLIESDVLEDRELDSFLEAQEKFDAITVWLIGSHLLRYHECDSLRGDIHSPGEYRLHVQSIAFAWAKRFLKPGGLLHLVDRGPVPVSSSMRNDLLVGPHLLASMVGGGLSVKSPECRRYTETDTLTRIEMVNASGSMVGTGELALISIIAVKTEP